MSTKPIPQTHWAKLTSLNPGKEPVNCSILVVLGLRHKRSPRESLKSIYALLLPLKTPLKIGRPFLFINFHILKYFTQ